MADLILGTIAVDLDGTITQEEEVAKPFVIPEPYPGAVDFLNVLSSKYRLIIHTARINEEWRTMDDTYTIERMEQTIRLWLAQHGMPPCNVWTGRGKPLADLFLDDLSITCAPYKSPEIYDELLRTLLPEQSEALSQKS